MHRLYQSCLAQPIKRGLQLGQITAIQLRGRLCPTIKQASQHTMPQRIEYPVIA